MTRLPALVSVAAYAVASLAPKFAEAALRTTWVMLVVLASAL